MICDECQTEISGTYFKQGERNICEKDYEAKYRKKCSKCEKSITGSYYNAKDNKFVCAECYKNDLGGSMDCRKCGKEVSGGELVRALDGLFHPDCFRCFKCNLNLSDKSVSFIPDEKKNIYCKDCYHKTFSPKCSGCEELIIPKPGEKNVSKLTALKKDWHPECFKCAECSVLFSGPDGQKCYPLEEVPLCMDCHKAKFT